MPANEAELRFAAELRVFLAPRHRSARAQAPTQAPAPAPVQAPVQAWVACDGTSTLGHAIQTLGVPLPEVGPLTVNGKHEPPGYRLRGGESVDVPAVPRPQPMPPAGFVLDVHLGTLARWLRLTGVDAAYDNDKDDDDLIEQANAEGRVLLTKDRGLLCRRTLRQGAFPRGTRADDQLRDVLDRFAPPLTPWTRCLSCNGPLAAADKAGVEHLLAPGTRRTQQKFARCARCGQVYWRGAHSARLEAVVSEALAVVGGRH